MRLLGCILVPKEKPPCRFSGRGAVFRFFSWCSFVFFMANPSSRRKRETTISELTEALD
jgi:hypothetical protein